MRTLYHGTSSLNLSCIKTIGLVPGRSKGGDAWAEEMRWDLSHLAKKREPSVFLAANRDEAEDFARLAAKEMGGNPIVITVHIPEAVFQTYVVDELFHQDARHPSAWRTASVNKAYIGEVLPVAADVPSHFEVAQAIQQLFAMI